MKLSKRLSAINECLTDPYDIIWDCCCDHGYLGISLLQRDAAKQVVFVDIVPKLMDKLSNKLTELNKLQNLGNKKACYQVLCQDVGNIELHESANQVVIIAGIGGELLLSLLKKIVAGNSRRQLATCRFILCPVHHTYALRVGIKRLGFGLLSEQIIVENKRYYEIINVSFNALKHITGTGSTMWDFTKVEHRQYQQQLLSHYKKGLNKEPCYYQHIIDDYQALYHVS
jgi:tRNA (adenine22-N1)-methyltransferase